MILANVFGPKDTLSDQERARGLLYATWEGTLGAAMFSVVGSGFLAAYALALGANNLQIGIMASIPFIMQPLQLPAIALVERLRLRKLIAVLMWYPAQAMWLVMALIPVFVDVPSGPAVSVLLGLLALRGALSAVVTCSHNPWLRDLVPQETMGQFFSRRLALGVVASMVFGLGGAFFVDYWKGQASPDNEIFGFTFALIFGSVFLGLTSSTFMAMMPEPRMKVLEGPRQSLMKMVAEPFRDTNYRHLMRFLFLWGFASTLAIPFFAVYMLTRLELPLSAVLGFTVLGQLFNFLFLRVWGPMADRLGNKSILAISASLYLLVIIGWTFTTLPERYFLTIPLLVLLHIMAGIAAGGVSLTIHTIGLKLAPQGEATSYLVGASLATSLGAAMGPLVGGRLADFFSVRELSLNFSWIDPTGTTSLPAIHLTGFDFLFAIAFIIGLITLNTLHTFREEGEVSREVALDELYTHSQAMSRSVSTVPGMGFVAHVPYSLLRHATPVPGLDVALGVLVYELAESAGMAVSATIRSGAAARNVAQRLSHVVSGAVRGISQISEHGVELSLQATRGAMHAVKEATEHTGPLAKQVVLGTLDALGKTPVDNLDALHGAGKGVVLGAREAGVDIGEATTQAIEAAREAASDLGFTEDEAASQLARGAIEAAETLNPEDALKVKDAVLDGLVGEESADTA